MRPAPTSRAEASWLRRAATGACRIGGALLLVLWLFARLTTDATLIGQLLWWASVPLVILAALLIGAGAWCDARPVRARSRWALALLALLACAWEAGWVLNVRSAWSSREVPTPIGATPGPSLLLLHWNLSSPMVGQRERVTQALSSTGHPDVILCSVQNYPDQWRALERAVRPEPSDGQAPAPVHFANLGMQKVFSRHPIVFARQFGVALTDAQGEPLPGAAPGWSARFIRGALRLLGVYPRNPQRLENPTLTYVTIDTRALYGRVTNICFIDYPSQPLAHRDVIGRLVGARIAQLAAAPADAPGHQRAPRPDVIIGDFNTPRGSDSLFLSAPGYTEASRSAGLGVLATWPRHGALLHIDHCLVAPDWRAAAYGLIDPGESEHKAQRVRVWPAK